MRLLTRYVIREMVGPTLLGFGFYTFVILMRSLFDFAEMIIKRSLPFSTVLSLLALSLPHIVVLTIPMSLLFGILIAVGRLSADSEIVAMRAAGLPTSAIYRPVFYFSFAVFLLNVYLMNSVLPRGNTALQELKADLFASPAISGALKPRIFFDQFEGRVIYVNDMASDGSWRGVFMSDTTDATQQRIIVADRGDLSFFKSSRQLWLNLYGAETHFSSVRKPERYDLNRNASQRFFLLDRLAEKGKFKFARSYREYSLSELWHESRHARDPIDRRTASVEMQKKLSIPFACLAFGIVGLPLGITNRRGGKSSGFSVSIGIILLYYVALNNGEDMALAGQVPPFIAMWLPNLLLVGIGIYLIGRANLDAGSASPRSGMLAGTAGLLRRITSRRRSAVEEVGTAEGSSLLARFDIPFPNTLDRYVLREFSKILVMVAISTTVLFLIVDYTELAGDISVHKIPLHVVASYYRYLILQVLNWILPLSVLLATLVSFGIFSKNNEVTAMKANGVSLYRTSLPVIAVAALVSIVSYFLLDFVLPFSNERMNQLHDQIKGKQTAHTFSVEQRQWLFGEGPTKAHPGESRHLFNFLSFDKEKNEISQLQVFEFQPSRFKLTRRIYADHVHWDGTGWWFSDGWIRSFSEDGHSSYSPITRPIKLQYHERPEYFATDVKLPNQMSYRELRRYIQNLQRSGYNSDELLVKLYQKTSEPVVSLIMALIALPFAFRVGKRGTLYGVGIAMFLAFVYYAFYVGFTKFGEVGHLPAILSAWSANILFAIAAIYFFLRVET